MNVVLLDDVFHQQFPVGRVFQRRLVEWGQLSWPMAVRACRIASSSSGDGRRKRSGHPHPMHAAGKGAAMQIVAGIGGFRSAPSASYIQP
jgi:hypothetical protein